MPESRLLPLVGAYNFRDLGGYPTANGRRTRWGRLFRSESTIRSKKHILIFVTPTLIDPAGNRIHREDNSLPAVK